MGSLDKIINEITNHIPTNLDGWHRLFSVFTIFMMPISLIYSYYLPDFNNRSDAFCYFDDSYFSVIKCENLIGTIFWNSFHPGFSLFYALTYLFPITIIVYVSAFRGICIIGYKAIKIMGLLLKSQKMIEFRNLVVRMGKKEIF